MKIPVVAEGKQVQLEAFAFDHFLIRHVGDGDLGKIRLAGDGAQAGEFRAVEFDEIVVPGMLVLKGFQNAGVIVGGIGGVLIAQQGQAFLGSLFHVQSSKGFSLRAR